MAATKETVIDKVKVWLTPGLISVLGMILWRDVTELRSDVKLLLSQSVESRTKIDELRRDVDRLNQKVFYTSSSALKPVNSFIQTQFIATKPEDYEIKPQKEEEPG